MNEFGLEFPPAFLNLTSVIDFLRLFVLDNPFLGVCGLEVKDVDPDRCLCNSAFFL